MTRHRLAIARRHLLAHAWFLSLAVVTRQPGVLGIAIDQLAYTLPCGGSGVQA
ncbi:MAG TPA: hypothetical protein VNR64_06765 [Vicinamibacterales bacterium]|nr:hypothetical protein [Vicinamibacterales bacterium]